MSDEEKLRIPQCVMQLEPRPPQPLTDEMLAKLKRVVAPVDDDGAVFVARTVDLDDGSGRGMQAEDFRDGIRSLIAEVERLQSAEYEQTILATLAPKYVEEWLRNRGVGLLSLKGGEVVAYSGDDVDSKTSLSKLLAP